MFDMLYDAETETFIFIGDYGASSHLIFSKDGALKKIDAKQLVLTIRERQ
jgi:hypothetical protein